MEQRLPSFRSISGLGVKTSLATATPIAGRPRWPSAFTICTRTASPNSRQDPRQSGRFCDRPPRTDHRRLMPHVAGGTFANTGRKPMAQIAPPRCRRTLRAHCAIGYREAGRRPLGWRRLSQRKRQFLAKSALTRYIVFQKLDKPSAFFGGSRAREGFGGKAGMARKWRCKPLKSLKTDSEIASRWLTAVDQVVKGSVSPRLSARRLN